MSKKTKREKPEFGPCPYCGSKTGVKPATVVYGKNTNYGHVLICSKFPKCDSYVKCAVDGRQKGTIASKNLRRLRMQVFDQLKGLGEGDHPTKVRAYVRVAEI